MCNVFIPVIPNGAESDPPTSNTDMNQFTNGINEFLSRYRGLVLGIFGIATITLIGLFIYYCMQLGNAGANPDKRKLALKNILKCGISAALLGAFTMIFALFYFSLL